MWLHWETIFGFLIELSAASLSGPCTHDQLVEAAEGALLFHYQEIAPEDYNTANVAGMVINDAEF